MAQYSTNFMKYYKKTQTPKTMKDSIQNILKGIQITKLIYYKSFFILLPETKLWASNAACRKSNC